MTVSEDMYYEEWNRTWNNISPKRLTAKNVEMVKAFEGDLDARATGNGEDDWMTMLQKTVICENWEGALALIKNGASVDVHHDGSVNSRFDACTPPLILALKQKPSSGKMAVVKSLVLDGKANVNQEVTLFKRGDWGQTIKQVPEDIPSPLEAAALWNGGDLEAVKFLLANGISFEEPRNVGVLERVKRQARAVLSDLQKDSVSDADRKEKVQPYFEMIKVLEDAINPKESKAQDSKADEPKKNETRSLKAAVKALDPNVTISVADKKEKSSTHKATEKALDSKVVISVAGKKQNS